MFNTSDSVPRSDGAVSRLAQKLRKRPMQTIGKKRAPAQGEMKFALPDEMHSTYAPYSPYVTTPYGRALKAATTKGKPRRMYTRGYVPKYVEKSMTHIDPKTHEVVGTGTYSVLSREKPKGSPLFRDIIQHPTQKDKYGKPLTKIHYGYTEQTVLGGKIKVGEESVPDPTYRSQAVGIGGRKKVGGVMATVVGKYPAYHKERYRAAAYLKARFGIESEKIRSEMYGKGPSEQEIKTAQRSAHKGVLGAYKKQVQEEAGGERLSVKETRDRMRKLIDREIQAHRDYRAGELRESRAIIHARGVPLRVAKAENERISDYVGRLGEMAKARKTGLEGVQTRGVGRVQGILERGVKKIDPQITPNVLPEEISRRAGKLAEGFKQEEASGFGPLSDIQRSEISRHLKGGMPKVRATYKGKPQPMESRVEKLYGRMQRLRDLSRTPGGEANIREGLVRSKKLFTGMAPTITSVEKEGYPYLKRAGIGLGLAGGLIGGAYLTKKIFFPPHKKQQTKQLNFAVKKPGVGTGLEKLIPFARPRNRDLPRLTRLRKARDWYRRKTIGQVKRAYGITGEEVVNLPVALKNVQGLQEETADKLSIARKQTRMIEAESERKVAQERAATGPLIEAEAQKRYERGYNLGKREEAARGKSYREEQVANVRETLGSQHRKSLSNLKWAGAGLITGAGAGGYIIGRGKRQRDHQFSIFKKQDPDEEPSAGPTSHDIATGAVEGGLGYLATDRLLHKFAPNLGPVGKFGAAAGLGGLSTGLIGYGLNRLIRKKIAQHKQQQQMGSRLKLIQFERRRAQPRTNQRALVARDRYIKQIHQQDIDAANRHYVHTALLGGAIGALARKPSTALSKAVLTGSAVGVGTQALVRAHTAETKDIFGEKSWEGKREEKIPQYAGAGILGVMALRRLRKKSFSLGGRVIYFDDDTDKDWLASAAHKALYKKTYSSEAHAQKVKKWFGRGSRIATDIQQSRSGVVPTDARGRPRKREWEKPWVAAAGTILALRGGFWGLGKIREGIRNAPIKSVVGQVREGFLRGDYSKKVPGLQKVGQAYQGFKKDVKKLVYKEAKDPKYSVPKINPKTNKPYSEKQMTKMLATEGQRAEFKDIAAGKKNKLAFVPTKKPTPEEKEWSSGIREIRFRSVKWEDNPLYPKDQKKDVRRIPISKIVSHQNTIKRHIVEEYKKKPGKALPTLQKVGDKYYVEDGNHRIVSKMEKGEKTVRASIREMMSRLREIRFAQVIPDWDIRDARGKSARVYAPGSQRRHREEMPEWRKKDTQRHILEAAIIGTAGLGGLGIRAAGKRGFQLGREAEAHLAGHPPGVRLRTILGYPFKVVESGALHAPKDPIPFSARLREIRFEREGRRPLLKAEIGAGSLAAGLGAYGLLRHPGRAPVRGAMKAIRERAGAHGFARVHMHDKPTGFLGKLVSEISEPADIHQHVTANRSYYKTKSKAVVFDPENTGKLQSPMILGKMNKTARDIRQHKLKEYNIARKMGLKIPETAPLGNPYTLTRSWIAKPATGSMSHALTIDDFMAHNPVHHDLIDYKAQKKALGPLKGNAYYKADAALSHHPGVKRYHVEQALKHPDRYVRQRKLDIAKEYRVHMIGGEPMGVSSARHSVRQFFLNRNKPAEAAATKMLKRVDPKLKQNLLAMDIVRTKKGGWHVIETNPGHDSGFLTPTSGSAMDLRGPHALYKSVTGRYSRLVSGAGGAAAAAGVAGTGALLTRKKAQG